MLFQDRVDAGQRLGERLRDFFEHEFSPQGPSLVLALPRGGVPVAAEVALALHAPLDVFVVRKLGSPGQEELAMGAIAFGGIRVINTGVVSALGIAQSEIERVAFREQEELQRREQLYRGDRRPLEVRGRCVILVDDGLATGYTMRAAIAALREETPQQIVVAVPVASGEVCRQLQQQADAVVCLVTPSGFVAVGQWYRDFSQTSDEEVRRLLDQSAARVE